VTVPIDLYRWSPEEDRHLQRYARAVIAGRFRNVREAARALLAARSDLAARHPDAAGWRAARTLFAVEQRIRARTRKLGRPVVNVQIRPDEARLYDRYARDLAAGRFASTPQAALACRAELERRGEPGGPVDAAQSRRLYHRVRRQIYYRARSLDRKGGRPRWSAGEMQVVERYARAVAAGRYGTLKEAAARLHEVLSRRPGGPAAGRRSRQSALVKLEACARRYGRRVTRYPFWSPEESRIVTGYARDVVRGRFRSAMEAGRVCHREFVALRRRYPKAKWLAVVRSPPVIGRRIWRIARHIGRPRVSIDWDRLERLRLDAYARRIIRGEFSARTAARRYLADIDKLRRQHPDLDWLRVRRSFGAVCSKMVERAHELGRPLQVLDWSPPELALARDYAQAVLTGRFTNAAEASKECTKAIQDLHRRRPDARWSTVNRTRVAVAMMIAHIGHKMAGSWPDTDWLRSEIAVLDKHLRGLADRRYRYLSEAGRACHQDLARRHRLSLKRRAGIGHGAEARTLEAVQARLRLRSLELGIRQKKDSKRWSAEELAIGAAWARKYLRAARQPRGSNGSRNSFARRLCAELARRGYRRTWLGCLARLQRIEERRQR
jgi:hypothetical protein